MGYSNKIENGVDPEHLLSGGYGHQLHVWDPRRRKHLETIELAKKSKWSSNCDRLMIRREHLASPEWSFLEGSLGVDLVVEAQ